MRRALRAALLAGVPVQRAVAGVAMGLMLEQDGHFKILTDILGSEDAMGDMDFKVAGDADAITAFQMDIKVGQPPRYIEIIEPCMLRKRDMALATAR